ncbi:hypothetical protein PF006_g19201 [Phytophthora fragariae]|uniref:Uncharacterized protein n=1 Tax=Phytophthora fragariae TaxID=53985 RepID=A0A6A3SFT3_9STRA|nr:hypothetical protein PF003_g39486 [Phytophthora fragariae]KAE9115764.1 hypothetical protein PF006_g19201 [Phytophthora fragariae]
MGSDFLTRPRGLWESDYRFAVAGRLNQVVTHSVLQRRHRPLQAAGVLA